MTTEQMNKLEVVLKLLNSRIERAEKDMASFKSEWIQTRFQAMLDAYNDTKEDLLFFFDEFNT